MGKEKDSFEKAVVTNRKAYHDYFIEEKFEAGIMLQGTEVKSLRDGRVNLQDSYASVKGGEAFLHRKEINKLLGKTQQQGLTIIPLRIYFSKRGFAKIELGLAKGKKQHDRRESIKTREAGREVERAMKEKR